MTDETNQPQGREPEVELTSIRHGNGIVETGQPGDVAIRNSWLINPKDVISADRNADGEIVVKTVHGNFILSKEEAWSIGVHV